MPFGELASEILDRARPALANIKLVPGYEMRFAGEDEELRKNRAEMNNVMMISPTLIFVTMVLQFRSVIKSLVVIADGPARSDRRRGPHLWPAPRHGADLGDVADTLGRVLRQTEIHQVIVKDSEQKRIRDDERRIVAALRSGGAISDRKAEETVTRVKLVMAQGRLVLDKVSPRAHEACSLTAPCEIAFLPRSPRAPPSSCQSISAGQQS